MLYWSQQTFVDSNNVLWTISSNKQFMHDFQKSMNSWTTMNTSKLINICIIIIEVIKVSASKLMAQVGWCGLRLSVSIRFALFYTYIYQMNWVNSRHGCAVITASKTFQILLLLLFIITIITLEFVLSPLREIAVLVVVRFLATTRVFFTSNNRYIC